MVAVRGARYARAMPAPLSVVIPTLQAEAGLARTLAGLARANEGGLLQEVVVSDGGSTDATCAIADEAGCHVVTGPPGRGGQLARGADAARGAWLLFLHADTVLEEGWTEEASAFIRRDAGAGAFRHAFAGAGLAGRAVSAGANLRTRLFRMPFGDQGLLVSKVRYARSGGYDDLALFEDWALVRRLVNDGGRRAVRPMRARAYTSPERYVREGYARRVWRNQRLVAGYLAGVPPARLAAIYA